MSLLSTFTRNKKALQVEEKAACQHPDLAPRWSSAADMGKQDLITHYQCCSCGATVSREDAQAAS